MRNMIFTPPLDQKIKDKTKKFTSRYWLQRGPRLGEVFTASTGRRKEDRFAEIRVVGAFVWNPFTDPMRSIEERFGLSIGEIVEGEGFDTWQEFIDTYKYLNKHKLDNPDGTHYFIEFEVVKLLGDQIQMF